MKGTTPTLSFDPNDKKGVVANLEGLLAHRLAIQGNSGSGKSWLLRTLIEGTHGHVQHLIIDPEGEFRTLREVFDDYIILEARDGDLDIAPENAENTARLLIAEGVSIILDLSEFGGEERDFICAAVIRGLMSLSRDAWRYVLVIVDEAQTLAPQVNTGSASLDTLTDLAMRGRKRGFGLVVATQRLALLNKNLLAMCSNRLIGLTTLGNDMKRASEELGFNMQERRQLKTLEPGEFFAFGPALSQEVVKVRSVATKSTHPAPGQLTPPTPPASRKLGDLLEHLRLGYQDAPSEEEVNEKVRAPAQSRALQKAEKREMERAVKPLPTNIESTLEQIRILADNVIVESAQLVPAHISQDSRLGRADSEVARGLPTSDHQSKHQIGIASVPTNSAVAKQVSDDPRRRILHVLAEMELLDVPSLDRSTLAVLSEQSPKSSAFSRHIASLHSDGFVVYPSGGQVALTEQGRASIPAPSKPATLADLHERWFSYLRSYERQLLEELIEVHPSSLSRRGLAKRVDRSEDSSAFSRALANLRRLKLVAYPADKHVQASKLVFPKWAN